MGRIPVLKYFLSDIKCRFFPRSRVPRCLPDTESPRAHAKSGGIRIYRGQTGDEILPIYCYCDGRVDHYRLFPGLVLFRLVAPPLHQGVVEPYLSRGAWFPSCLLRRCVPALETWKILERCHSLPYGGHYGAFYTNAKVWQCGFYWPTVYEDAKSFVR
jgi:hypothetical protein